MQDVMGDRQQELLTLLVKHKSGLTIDELSASLSITRTATMQHLTNLTRLNYVEEGAQLSTKGRPSRTYRLTAKGYEWFPKQYPWFSEILLQGIREKLGEEGLKDLLVRMGEEIGSRHGNPRQGETLRARLEKTVLLMNELSYQAKLSDAPGSQGETPAIEATNCVYHHLAKRFPQVCDFDLALLSKMSGADVVHEECIVRGGAKCRFAFKKQI